MPRWISAATSSNLSLPQRKFRARRAQITPITTFQSGHGWTMGNGGGALSSIAADPYVPSASARVTLSSAGTQTWIQGLSGFTPDLSSKAGPQNGLVFGHRWSSKADFGNAGQTVLLTSGGNQGGSSIGAVNVGPPDGEWGLTPVQFGYQAGVNLAGVTGISVNMQPTAGKTPTVDYGMVGTWKTDGVGRVVVFGDDGLDTFYEMAKRAHGKGVKMTSACIPGEFGNPGFLTVAQAKELHDQFGVEFVVHARTIAEHNNADLYKDPVAFEASLRGARELMIQHGLVNGIDHYATAPNWGGQRDDAQGKAAGAIADKYFPGLFRLAASGFNGDAECQCPFGNEKRIRTGMFQTGINSNLSNLQGMLDRAAHNDGVAVLVFHGLGASDNFLTISRSTFDAFMTEVATARSAAGAGAGVGTTLQSCTFSEAFAG